MIKYSMSNARKRARQMLSASQGLEKIESFEERLRELMAKGL